MSWINIALGFVFFCNAAFMVGAIYLLLRILDSTERSQIHLQKAASHVVEAGAHVKALVRNTFHEMQRNTDALAARESSAARAVEALTFQIKTLIERVKTLIGNRGAGANAPEGEGAQEARDSAEDLKAKLHDELQSALAKNHTLRAEIDQTHYKLKEALRANRALRDELHDAKGVGQELIDSLSRRAADLEAELEQARSRAQRAEEVAAMGAAQMEDIRNQIDQQRFDVDQPVDQSELITSQQGQIDLLAAREKELCGKIDALEGALTRSQTEKLFIEDRFLKLDGGDTTAG